MNYLHRLLPGDKLMVTVPARSLRGRLGRSRRAILMVEKAVLENRTFWRYHEGQYSENTSASSRPVVVSLNVCAVLTNGQPWPAWRSSYAPTEFSEILVIWRGHARYNNLKELPRSDLTSTSHSTYLSITPTTGQTIA